MTGGHRRNVHQVMLTAELDVALSKLRAALEIGDTYAVLYGLVEGMFKLGYLSQENHDLLITRYSRKLVDVRNEKRTKRENSHIPVLTLEQQKAKVALEAKDREFQGVLEQWDSHPDPVWRTQKILRAQKYPELASSKLLLAKVNGEVT